MRRLLLVALLFTTLAGCGGDDGTTPTTTETTTEVAQARVYFLRDGKVWPVLREIPEEGDAASEIVAELVAGPTLAEEQLGLTSSFPEGVGVTVASAVASVQLESELTAGQRAQLVYSLTQLDPVVTSVEIGGTSYTRADFEGQTPSVLVESPLPFQDVTSPVRATGTANTFEATFHYELTDTDGRIVDENFVTATSGTGTRGTFELTTEPFTIPFDGVGALIVFERSAEDGSRMNVVEIPLRMSQ